MGSYAVTLTDTVQFFISDLIIGTNVQFNN